MRFVLSIFREWPGLIACRSRVYVSLNPRLKNHRGGIHSRSGWIIEDSPADFSGYRPKNFDMGYQGDVSIREALQLSLNVPAIRVLDAVGPARLTARFRQAGVTPVLPINEAPGLAIGLGGVGVTLRDLVQLYTGLANGGKAHTLHDGTEPAKAERSTATILDDQAT